MSDSTATTHRYRARVDWRGSTGSGYEMYDRGHSGSAEPADQRLALSADPAFRGAPSRLNPEQLLVVAAASCQMLSFLALAARARIDVVAYEDEAEAEMPESESPVRITRIRLRPTITVNGQVSEIRVRRLVELGHEQCYIANTLACAIDVEPKIVSTVGPTGSAP